MILGRKELRKALPLLKAAAGKSKFIPILSTVRLESLGDSLVMCSTDLEVGARVTLKGHGVPVSPVCVEAAALTKAIPAKGPDPAVRLESLDGDRLRVDRVTLQGQPVVEYPSLPDPGDTDAHESLGAAMVAECLRQVTYAASRGKTQHNLCGVHVAPGDAEHRVRFVGCDGHRLAMAEPPIAVAWPFQKQHTILPLRFALLLERATGKAARWGDNVVFRFAWPLAEARIGPVSLFCKLVDGEYPDYRQVLPRGAGKAARAVRADVLGALDRLAPVLPERSNAVKLTFCRDTGLTLEASSANGEGHEELAASISEEASGVSLWVNARYLREAFEAADAESVRLELQDSLSPFTLRGETSFALLMPMRL